jgi:ribosome-binding ATPase YchF (GTP1/OBG family)
MKDRTPESKTICEFLAKILEFLKKGIMLNKAELNLEEIKLAKQYSLLTYKPFVHVLNVGEKDLGAEIKLDLDVECVPICGKMESELLDLDEQSRTEFMKEMNIRELGLHRLVKAGYRILGLVTFFTTESKEVKAWTVKKGAKAPEAAGRIHTDMERGFIRAEVVNYETLMKYGDIAKTREHGELKMEGREYMVRDGDVIKFYFNV